MLFEPYVRFHILVQFGYLNGHLLGSSCSLGLRIFSQKSWYKYLSVILVFHNPRFLEWEFLSDCAIS